MMEAKRKIAIALPVTGDEEWQAVRDSFESGWLAQGPRISEFEKAFANMHKVENALAVSSGTTALHVILAAMGIGPGDEVIVPSFTWIATANAVMYCGARPVFADICRDTFNIDPDSVKELISDKTRAIVVVHQFGNCADMDALFEVAGDIQIVEDAACAAGSTYKGRMAGSMGLAAAFSFHPRKSITTGEGGMVTTSDAGLAEKVIMLRNHGATLSADQRHNGDRPYLLPDFDELGFNYRMTDIQGAIGIVQLRKLNVFIEERNRMAHFYKESFATVDWLITPSANAECRHSWQSYVCYIDERKAPMSRNDIMNYLLKQGISTRPGTHAVHMLGLYRNRFSIEEDSLPVARDCDRYSMAIPLHNRMSMDDCRYVADRILEL